jgi:hypothetical protein
MRCIDRAGIQDLQLQQRRNNRASLWNISQLGSLDLLRRIIVKTRRTIWMSIGTLAAGTVLSPIAAGQSSSPEPHVHDEKPLSAKPGGEGGEGGGEAGAGASPDLPPNLRFARAVALIRGHFIVGDELVKAGRWTDALPHFLHPGEEIYGGIKGDLHTYGVRPFESALKSLAQTVKAKRLEAYDAALALVRTQLAAADDGLRKLEADWPRFTLETALEVLRQATDEYGEAIEGGRIEKAVEYQDARGFVWEAERLIDSIGEELRTRDAEALASLRADLASLKKTWPSPVPPAKPVKDHGEVLGDVARIELHAGHFL